MIKYIAYCRKSTDEKDRQVLSIEAQIAELKEFAKREKLEVVDFLTESKTAKIPGRKVFNQLIKLIEKGQASGILSWHPDRLARNSIDGGKIIYLLDTGKLLDLKFPSFWFDNTPQGKFMLSIAFSQSKYYVDNLSENVKRGNRQKLRRGEWPSKAPLGYLNEPRLRTIEIDPERSKFVNKAFRFYAEGNKSLTNISNYLYKFGVKGQSGKPLHVTATRHMLTNKFYIGILHYDGEYYQGSHKLFVPKKLFENVQNQVEKIEKPRPKGHDFAFTGLARCGECGAAITAEVQAKFYPTTRGKVEYIYYHCTKKLGPCFQKGYVREELLEQQVRKIVAKAGLHPGWKKHFDNWMARDEQRDKQNAKETLQTLRLEINEVELKLNRLLDGYLDQVIEPQVYRQKKNELFEEKLKIQEQITKISKDNIPWLELMQEFINCALRAQKIVRAKNNCHELTLMAKKVGSNYLLKERRLSATLEFAFGALFLGGGCAAAPPNFSSISKMVDAYRKIRTYFKENS